MHVDSFGLPAQADGDVNDQAQRTAMLALGYAMNLGCAKPIKWSLLDHSLRTSLQPRPGVYCRYTGANPNNCSADQIISILAYWVAVRDGWQIFLTGLRMVFRLGFAQNFKDGLGNNADQIKLPDFMALRALPLLVRLSPLLYPLALASDVLLLLGILSSCGPVWKDGRGFRPRNPDDTDDNVFIMTLCACRRTMPTPLSILACRLYGFFRPANHGGEPAVIGALRWYHRPESGGNPEIAGIYEPIVKRLFL